MALRTSMCIVYRVSCIVYCVLCIVYVNKGMNQSINRPKQCFYFLFVHRFFISRSTIFSTPNPTSSACKLSRQEAQGKGASKQQATRDMTLNIKKHPLLLILHAASQH